MTSHSRYTQRRLVHIFKQPNLLASQAWAPLVRGMRFKHPSVAELAERYGKAPAQILLRYSLQKVRQSLKSASNFNREFPMGCRDISRFPNHRRKNESSQTPSYSILNFPPRILSIWTVSTKVCSPIILARQPLTVQEHRACHGLGSHQMSLMAV